MSPCTAHACPEPACTTLQHDRAPSHLPAPTVAHLCGWRCRRCGGRVAVRFALSCEQIRPRQAAALATGHWRLSHEHSPDSALSDPRGLRRTSREATRASAEVPRAATAPTGFRQVLSDRPETSHLPAVDTGRQRSQKARFRDICGSQPPHCASTSTWYHPRIPWAFGHAPLMRLGASGRRNGPDCPSSAFTEKNQKSSDSWHRNARISVNT